MNFENFQIRLLDKEDLQAYYNMVELNRKRLEDFFTGTVSRTQTKEDTSIFLDEIMGKIFNKMYFPYIIIDENTNEFIGFIDVKNIDWNLPKAELGCYIDYRYSGKGISHNALTLVMDYLFTTYHFHKLFLRTHPSNIDAIRLAEKCGFQKEGLIRQDYKTTNGEIVDLLYFGKLKGEN